jgi:hypothetical protein
MGEPLPPVDESHRVMADCPGGAAVYKTKDGKVHVIHNVGEHLSGRRTGVTRLPRT